MDLPNKEEVKRALAVLYQPGDTIEVRCVGHGLTIGGFYRDQEKLAQDACTLNLEHEPKQNVFTCLNPVNHQLHGRRADTFGKANKGEGVKDSDVTCRRWLLIDVDPIRPSGVSATDAQKRAAHAKGKHVLGHLIQDLCLPEPVCADSGNGCHLLLPLANLPNNQETRWACEQLLRRLGDRFTDPTVKIDQTTFNAARICTVYGTVKRKGSDIPEQPHRLSKMLYVPDPLVTVRLEQLLAVVGPYPGDQQRTDLQLGNIPQPDKWDIEKILRERGIDFDRDDNYVNDIGPGTCYVLPVCPWNPDHNDRAAYIVQFRSGAVVAGCHHDGCKDKGNNWQTLKSLWGLPVGQGISAADIVLPPTQQRNAPSIYTAQALPITGIAAPVASVPMSVEPPQIRPEAFHGPLGEIVLAFAPKTEASPVAMLVVLLLHFGNAIGRRFFVELDGRHFFKIFVALVGPTASGRKGTAGHNAQLMVDAIDPTLALCRHSGLTTGEGLLKVLTENMEAGAPRPVVFEEHEFAAVMKRKERLGNTLGTSIRLAWDDVPLAVSTKTSPIRVSGSHISIVAHATPRELQSLLSDVDIGNGFANRFIWIYTHRTRQLPGARSFQAELYLHQVEKLRAIYKRLIEQNLKVGGGEVELPLSAEAKESWPSVYAELDPNTDEESLLIQLGARRIQHVMRIAGIFALADGAFEVGMVHIQAARAIVDYSSDTMDFIYSRPWWGEPGNAHDPAGMAPKLLEALKSGAKQRSDISIKVFRRNYTAKELNGLRDLLVSRGQLIVEPSGRSEIWRLPQTTP